MRSMRCALAAGCLAAALLSVPAVAAAEIRQGKASDPVGDSAGAPSQDIVSATARYDTNGQMSVSATMSGDIATGAQSFLSFAVKSYAAPDQCAGSSVSMFGSSDSQYNLVTVTGVSGLGDSLIVRNGPTISFGAGGTALRDRDYSCMTLTVSLPGGGGIVDQLNVPLFFDGFGPDGDADGVKDNQDACPAEVGPAPSGCAPDTDRDGVKDPADQCPVAVGPSPTGCPAAATPPTTTQPGGTPQKKRCAKLKLKGKTLKQARKALRKAGCRLGKVTKPKRARKGAKLVVKKQSGSNPVKLTLGVKK